MISVPSHDGREFSAYLALPAAGRGPGVVVLQEVFGVNHNMRDACDWFAARGFVALCPDLSWRIEPGVESGQLDVQLAVDDAGAALDFLRAHPACNGRAATVGYGLGGRLSFLAACTYGPDAAVSYYGVGIEKSLGAIENLASPLMLHIAEPSAAHQISKALANHPDVEIHLYPQSDPAAIELANLRTLDFLIRHLSPKHSLEAIWGEHIEHEFATRDTERTLATMVDDAYVNHIPVLTGGSGKAELREFYSKHFIPQMPSDTSLTPISRTIGDEQIVDEMIFRFTHTIRMDWMLPGVEPTGKRVEVPLVAIVKLIGDKLAHEHIYWDQASVLVQLGLLDSSKLPVAGVETARKAVDPKLPSRKLP